MPEINYVKTIFPNGLRYIFVPEPQSLATTVLVLVAAGSEYETKDKSGISHFLEHLCFKGTTKRPRSGAIAAELDALGAEYNAFTANEMTGYYAKAANKNFEKILEIVADLYMNPIIDQAEMDRERGVILEEINMYEDLPMEKVKENFAKLLYGDQPAGWSVAGNKEVIRRLNREDIVAYRTRHYLPPKTTVIVCGGIPENPEKTVWKYFEAMPRGETVKKEKTIDSQTEPELNLQTKSTDQLHLVLGSRGINAFDPRRYALMVLADILGGSMSSRMFVKIRDEMGAAYYVRSGVDESSDHGSIFVAAGIDKTKMIDVCRVILAEFEDLKNNPVSEAELNKAKEHLSGNLILQLETSDDIAVFFGAEEIVSGKVLTPAEVLRKIKEVTPEDIRSLAGEIFKKSRLNLAAIGPDFEEKALRDLLQSVKI
ncbi:MAG: insulinase family protein [Patescibacteria group bacterium]|nr:insulinase family protein [Patescibacteria group bacterium]MCL5262091.1 insulinase family protein [Patescibacteria group bacterium]